jgi:two-component system cell cycle response regulator
MRILVAEDDGVSAKVLEKALQRLGHEPVIVGDGIAAWEAVQAETFPVIISDWMMPGLEGPELCLKTRELQRSNYSFFIILTAKGQKEDRILAMQAGADDFLSKPLDRDELLARLSVAERILAMQGKLHEQNLQLESQRKSLEATNLKLTQQSGDLSTAMKNLEATSRVAEVSRNRFSQLFEGLPVACFTYDSQGIIYEWNRRSEEMFNAQPFQAIGKPVREMLGIASVDDWETIRTVLQGVEFTDREFSDSDRHLLASGLPLYGPDGTITGGIIAAVDISELRRAQQQIATQLVELNEAHDNLSRLNERLAALAVTDALTGIPNHRAFQDRLSQLVDEGKRGRQFALAMLDVDKFKNFNDEFGHQAGDEVLESVAAALRDGIRKTDFVARYGGEEFCVLFSDVDEERAFELSEKLRQAIEQIECPYRKITASFGVCAQDGKKTGAALIKAADTSLYKAKEAGRNRVVRFSSLAEEEAA